MPRRLPEGVLSRAPTVGLRARSGYALDRDRVLLYQAACAVTFLAFRAGFAPDERRCGGRARLHNLDGRSLFPASCIG
jgi:hypothetical protein